MFSVFVDRTHVVTYWKTRPPEISLVRVVRVLIQAEAQGKLSNLVHCSASLAPVVGLRRFVSQATLNHTGDEKRIRLRRLGEVF